jgi:hypothetical protein
MGHLARTSLVNGGQDTLITLLDGSTIVLKGVTRIDAVFPTTGAAMISEPTPIGRKIGDDSERAHHRGNGREGMNGIAE